MHAQYTIYDNCCEHTEIEVLKGRPHFFKTLFRVLWTFLRHAHRRETLQRLWIAGIGAQREREQVFACFRCLRFEAKIHMRFIPNL